jgi:hypothetical protein
MIGNTSGEDWEGADGQQQAKDIEISFLFMTKVRRLLWHCMALYDSLIG